MMLIIFGNIASRQSNIVGRSHLEILLLAEANSDFWVVGKQPDYRPSFQAYGYGVIIICHSHW